MKILTKAVLLIWLLAVLTTTVLTQEAVSYLTVSQEFEQLVAHSLREHRMPRIAENRVAELLSILSDSQRYLDSASYQVKDLGTLMEICGKANAAVMSYALFDLKNKIDPRLDPSLARGQRYLLMQRNIVTFQDELAQLQPFLFRCFAKQIPLLTEFALSLKPEEFTDIRRAGLKQAQDGIFSAYYGFLGCIKNPELKESYSIGVIQVMSETAHVYSSVLQPAARQQILDLTRGIQTNAPQSLSAHLEKIAAAMSDTRCDGLCKF